MDLLKRRAEVLEQHRKLEKARGSGWHPADPGALEREQRGESFLSERPVAMQDEDEIHVVGPCAATVRAALAAFLARAAEADLLGYGPQYQQLIARVVKRLLRQEGDLLIPSREWNCLAAALDASGVQIVLTAAA